MSHRWGNEFADKYEGYFTSAVDILAREAPDLMCDAIDRAVGSRFSLTKDLTVMTEVPEGLDPEIEAIVETIAFERDQAMAAAQKMEAERVAMIRVLEECRIALERLRSLSTNIAALGSQRLAEAQGENQKLRDQLATSRMALRNISGPG